MVIEISLPKKIGSKKICKENKQDNQIKESLFLELERLVKDISTGADVKKIIIIEKDDVMHLGYKDRVEIDEYLLRPSFQRIKKETGIDVEELINTEKLEIGYPRS